MKIRLDIKQNLTAGIKDFDRAAPIATRKTLGIGAAVGRRNAVGILGSKFTERNTFTRRQIQFRKPRGRDISKMRSAVGATVAAPYMALQETGGTRKKRGRATAIPQKGARLSLSQARAVRKPRYISRVEKRRVRGRFQKNYRSSKARAVARMAVAFKRKKYFQRGANLFEVKRFQAKGNVQVDMNYLYKAERKNIRIPRRQWLAPAVAKPARDLPFIWRGQIRRLWKARPEI